MEIRMRSAVSRTAKGYSVEATLDMGGVVLIQQEEAAELITSLSVVQITALQKHMKALGEAFPKEEA